MGLQDVIRFILPREDHFYGFLEEQAKVAKKGALALQSFGQNKTTAADARSNVQEIEHEGDRIVHEMEEALAKTFVTPIDREDLQKLSSVLDTILDLMNGAIRACVMLGVKTPTEPMQKLIEVIVRASTVIDEAIPKLRKHEYEAIVGLAREIRKIEKDADTIYREAISVLFHDDNIDAKSLIRQKSVLEDLENAVDACDSVADILANLAVKHG